MFIISNISISNLPKLNTWGLDVSGCTGSVSVSGSDLNLTDYIQGSVPFSITGQSYVRAISSQVPSCSICLSAEEVRRALWAHQAVRDSPRSFSSDVPRVWRGL